MGSDVQLKHLHLKYTFHTKTNLWRVLTIYWSLILKMYSAVKECRPGGVSCVQAITLYNPFYELIKFCLIVNMFYTQMFLLGAFFFFSGKPLPWCLEVLQSMTMSLDSFVLGSTGTLWLDIVQDGGSSGTRLDTLWYGGCRDTTLFLLNKYRKAQSLNFTGFSVLNRRKNKSPSFYCYFMNEDMMTMTTQEGGLLSELVRFADRRFSEWKWPSGDFPKIRWHLVVKLEM